MHVKNFFVKLPIKLYILFTNSILQMESSNTYLVKDFLVYITNAIIPAGSKKIEKDRNWEIGKGRTFLSLPTHHFAFPKLYLFLSPHLSGVTGLSIFFYPYVW